ncbi:MAG: family 20 glycosylhydrolase [Bacteroidota bacterium]
MRILPLLVLLLLGCGGEATAPELPETDLSQAAIIPLPYKVTATNSAFLLDEGILMKIQAKPNGPSGELENFISLLGEQLAEQGITRAETGRSLQLILEAPNSPMAHSDWYQLDIEEEAITLRANSQAGLSSGSQTLLQLLALRGENNYLATGTIEDHARFVHRGFMLDVSRHFFGLETVKKIIDYLAFYKINRLHLHLSDDQGWRLEIKSFPNLTEHGGSTEVGGGPGGFYTQAEYRELVEYARIRQIMVIPEFDMPGHTNAALASYPDLNCDGKARELYTGTEVGFSSFCIHSEFTYHFVDSLIREVAAITTGSFIHIGGDEVHTLSAEDYAYFIERVAGIVQDYGKQVMGWDEIAQADLPPGSVAQYWNFAENAQAAVAQDVQVLFSPATRAYLDMKYDSTTELGLAWAAYIELEDAYDWDPVGMVEGVEEQHIIGVEAPLWAETIEELADIEYLLFPRLAAIAEVGWTSAGRKDWSDFKGRAKAHSDWWSSRDINYYPSPNLEAEAD